MDFKDYLNQKYGGSSNTASGESFDSYISKKYGATQTKEPASVVSPVVEKKETIPVVAETTPVKDTNTSNKSYNVFQRMLDADKKKAYDQAQANAAQTKADKIAEGKSILDSLGKSGTDFVHSSLFDVVSTVPNALKKVVGKGDKSVNFATTVNDAIKGLNPYEVVNWGKKNGLSDKQIEAVKAYVDSERTAENTKDVTQFSKEHPYYGSVYSAVAKPGESTVSLLMNAENYLRGNPLQNYDYLNSADYARQGASSDMGNVGKFLYDTGMSAADMAVAMATGTGGNLLGLEKASSVMNDSINRGLNPNQILGESVVSGVTTALTERIPMGKWQKIAEGGLSEVTAKELAKVILASSATEGLQEMSEDVADAIADRLIAGNKSSINVDISNNIANGMSEKDAKANAWKDWITQTALDGLSGAISGGLMGGASSAYGANFKAKANPNQNVDTNTNIETEIEDASQETPEANIPEVNPMLARLTEEANAKNRQDSDLNVLMKEYEAQERAKRRLEEEARANEIPDLTKLMEEANKIPNQVQAENPNDTFNYMANEVEGRLERDYGEDDPSLNLFRSARQMLENGNKKSAMAIASQIGDADAKQLMISAINDMDLSTTSEARGEVETYSTEPALADTRIDLPNEERVVLRDVPGVDETVKTAKRSTKARSTTPTSNAIPNVEPTLARQTTNANPSQTKDMHVEPTREKVAQTSTNTLNSKAFFDRSKKAAEALAKAQKDRQHTVDRVSEAESIEQARKMVEEDYEGTLDAINKSNEISNVQIDASAIYMNDMLEEAERTGDYSKVIDFSHRIVEKVHDAAQGLQALAKYTRTGAGTVLKAQQLAERASREYFGSKKNSAKLQTTKKLADALKNISGNENTSIPNVKREATIDEKIVNTLQEYGDGIVNDFDKEDMNYLANLVKRGMDTKSLQAAIQQRVATGSWGLTGEDIAEINRLFKEASELGENSKGAAKLEAQAYAIASKALPGKTFMDKWNAWRYLAMLGNTRTHVRNILGNGIFGFVTNVKDAVGATIESTYAASHPEYEKTKAVSSRIADKALYDGARKYFNEEAYGLATDEGHKYNAASEIERAQRTFNSNTIEGINSLNSGALTAEDDLAIQLKYERSLVGYLKANNKDASIFKSTDPADVALLQRANENAIKEAKEATFHSPNATADALTNFSRAARSSDSFGLKSLGVALEAVMPFKKTPANILKQGIQYSPLGAFDAISKAKNHAEVNEVINSISKTMTGTGILALGYLLAQSGVLRGSGDDSDDLFDDQEYSINIGDFSYTIDWAAPAALPLFVGVELYNSKGEDGGFFDALASVSEPIIEMSMLQGLKDTFNAVARTVNDNETAGQLVANLGMGYASQGIPTALGQVARSVDPYRRATNTKSTGIKGTVEYQLEKAQNKTPASFLNDKYINAWGEEEKNTGGNFVGRLAYNMLSPGYYSNTNRTELESKLEALDSKKVLPAKPSKTYKYTKDGEQISERLDSKKFTELSRQTGKLYTEAAEIAVSNPNYDKLTKEDQVGMLTNVQNFTEALAKKNVLGYKIEDVGNYKKAYGIYQEKGMEGVVKYYTTKAYVDSEVDGKKGNLPVLQALEKSDMTNEEKGEYLYDSISELSQVDNRAYERGGLSELYESYKIRYSADSDGNGSTSQDELVSYLRNSDMSVQDRYKWFSNYYPDKKVKDIPSLY